MDFIQDLKIFRLFVASLLLTVFLGVSNAAPLLKPSTCSKQDTLFKPRNVYTYDYMVQVASSFLGASPSKSGSKLSCTVTLSVPRRCEYLLELSDCSLWERSQGADDIYKPVQDADQFLQDLQRYSTYFQMNEGIVVANSILADDRETIQTLNVKRGIISALQFPVLEEEEYKEDANTTDIFGRCPVIYSILDGDSDETVIGSERNLRHCDLPNIYTKQIDVMPGPSIGQMVGGVIEEPIKEMFYPFEMLVSCEHSWKDDQTLADVNCLQRHYFKPLAYEGDYIVTAMTNISQNLELKNTEKKKMARPDLSADGRLVVDIKFDFGTDFGRASTLTQIRDRLTTLTQHFVTSEDSVGYERVPGMFGGLVESFRHAGEDVLEDLMMEVFDCTDDCDDKMKVTARSFFFDGLKSCGTESCIKTFLHCMLHGHTTKLETAGFLQGLKDIAHVSEDVLENLHDYCKDSDETMCWLTLGTVLSKSSPDDVKEGTVLYEVFETIHDTIENNCKSGTLVDTERKLNTIIKTGKNIGYNLRKHWHIAKKHSEDHSPLITTLCLQNRVIPTSVKISILQILEDTFADMRYTDIPQSIVDDLFVILKDVTIDSTIRLLIFSLLTKTTNKVTINEAAQYMMKEDNTHQMKTYMSSAVKTLLQNDAPDLKEVRASWEAVRKENYYYTRFINPYPQTTSKSIGTGYFFKFPVSELFGGQLEADLIYDPSSSIFSTLKTSVSYYLGDEKYKLFEFMLRVQGFDLLMDVVLKRIDMTPQDLYDLYKNLKARAEGHGQSDEQLAKFQQNIVKAVEDILNEVNHPTDLDFDLSVDLSVKGKEVMFGSLRELMSVMRQMRSKLPPNTSVLQVYLKKLMSGMSTTTFKSKEHIGLIRDLPTCAGLPLNLTVHAYGTHIFENSLQSNLLMYMAKKSPTLSASMTPDVRMLHEFNGELAVQIGTSHSSGMKAKILLGAGRHVSLKLTYGYSDPMVLVENPTKKKLEFAMEGIYKNENRERQNIIYARGRMELNHYSGVETVQSDSTVETVYQRCNTDEKISIIARKKMCLDFVYPNVAASKSHAYFPLSGPFDLDITVEDLERVNFYKWIFEYERQKVPGAGYTDHFGIVGTDDTTSEAKFAYMNIVYNRDDYSLTVDSAVPDSHYTYTANFSNTHHRDHFDFKVAEMIKHHGLSVSGYIFKVFHKRDGDHRKFEFHWNVTAPEIGWDIQFHGASVGPHRDFRERSFDFSVTYYCSKERPLLYMFHLIPTWASDSSDRSNFRIKNTFKPKKDNEMKETASGMIEFYGRGLGWESYIEQDGPTTRAHEVLTYVVDGVEKTATADFSKTWGQSRAGLTLDLSGDLQADNFNVIATGSCMASKTDVTVSGDIEYHNTEEENIINRRKRSSVYEKLKKVEEAVVEEVVQIEKTVFGTSETDVVIATDGKNSEGSSMMKQIQDTDFPQLSIWDLKEWNAKVSLSADLKPIFAEGDTPGKVPPEGMEATGIFTAEHPWNGGYVKHTEHFTVGKNMRNTLKNYRVWLSGAMDTTFTSLDGTPIMDGDKPLVITQNGETHVYREAGKIFDFVFNYDGFNLKKEYSILFDWDASTHHEPLYHVKSEQTSELMPFFNHHFDEKLYWETGHIIHNLDFSHEMLQINVDTEFTPREDMIVKENGSMSVKVLEKVMSFKFENTADKNGKLQSSITPGSMPDKSFIYTFQIMDDGSDVISGAVKMEQEAEPTQLWSTKVLVRGTTMLEVTQTWTTAYQEHMENSLRQRIVRVAMMLEAVGNQKRANMDKPLADQTFMFTSLTPGDIMKQAFMPNFVRGMKFWGRFLGNMVPLQHRPTSPDIPGPVIAPRFAILMQAMKNPQNKEPNPVIKKLQFLDYFGIKAVSKLLFIASASENRANKIEEILKERKYTYVIGTTPLLFERLLDVPSFTEFYFHLYYQAKEMFGLARYYYRRKRFQWGPSKGVAMIFGRHESNRVLGVQTFDGNFFELTADKTEECSYLLASDLRQRRWSLVLSPAGVTLLTSSRTVTVGWDKNIYIDNCKVPSAMISEGPVTVEKKDDTINVDTTFGLNLQFDTTFDNCIITIEGPYRNETLGLLGTNDREKLTDFRLKQGHRTKDSKTFIAEYTISGSQTCMLESSEPSNEQEPEEDSCEEVRDACDKLFNHHYVSLYNCFNGCVDYGNNRYRYCRSEGRRCKAGVNSCHAVKAYIDKCLEEGLLEDDVQMQGLCQIESPVMENSISGSLDIVFVVSQHDSMTEKRNKAKNYMFELAVLDAWDQFKEVRLGAVLFGGSDAGPHAVRLENNENSLFTKRDDYDWDGLSEISEQTAGGTTTCDAFLAVEEATKFPFSPTAHKMIIVLMTKKQSTGKSSDTTTLTAKLKEKGITLNVISTYKKTSSTKIVGINWDGQVIQRRQGYHGTRRLPTNDYIELITATKGALWDLNVISDEHDENMKRMSEEFVWQMKQYDQEFCPAA